MTFGRTEFRRRWGDRKLEDNWRRANKTRNASIQNDSEEENGIEKTGADSSIAINDNKSPQFYLRNLPLTDSLLRISNDRIADALLKAGKAYAENINDTLKGTETYETLVIRFPGSPVIPEALYDLYRLNEKSNKIKAETYRQRLIERYPESEFTRILSDPDYYRNKMANLKLTEELYEEAYNLYLGERFDDAILKINQALYRFPENHLSSKFMLLHAYCCGTFIRRKILQG